MDVREILKVFQCRMMIKWAELVQLTVSSVLLGCQGHFSDRRKDFCLILKLSGILRYAYLYSRPTDPYTHFSAQFFSFRVFFLVQSNTTILSLLETTIRNCLRL